MRFYDPDGHIIEIGETLQAVVWRLYEQGLSLDLLHKKVLCHTNSLKRSSKNIVRRFPQAINLSTKM